MNTERQALEKVTLEQAEALAEAQAMRTNNLICLVVAGEDWHPGIVGLIASRLREKFKCPSFAFAFKGTSATGSGRGSTGVDLGKAVRRAVEAGVAERAAGMPWPPARRSPATGSKSSGSS